MFIIFILITTIICCHYLIRLCMLVMRARRLERMDRVPDAADENGFAQPYRPIRVILARDEELGLHDHNDEVDSNNPSIPPPPPAYGLWRCSVVCTPSVQSLIALLTRDSKRADPNLIHWQRTDEPGVQEEARALILAAPTLNRPPSYVSDVSLLNNVNPEMHVPPLFHRANTSLV